MIYKFLTDLPNDINLFSVHHKRQMRVLKDLLDAPL